MKKREQMKRWAGRQPQATQDAAKEHQCPDEIVSETMHDRTRTKTAHKTSDRFAMNTSDVLVQRKTLSQTGFDQTKDVLV